MSVFSNLELFEIIKIYAKTESYSETAKEFRRLFPNSPRLYRMYVQRLVCRLKNTGSLLPGKRTVNPLIMVSDMDIDILAYFYSHPQTSIRSVVKETNVPYSYVWRLLKKYKWHPYSLHGCQALLHTDRQGRLIFVTGH